MEPKMRAVFLIRLVVALIDDYAKLGAFASDAERVALLHDFILQTKRTFKGGKTQMVATAQVLEQD